MNGERPRSRVLVVDDNPTSRIFLQASLERAGLSVVAAEDAETAELLLAREGFDRFDCVVTDLLMPGRSGLDLLNTVRENDAHLSTVIVTGAGERAMVAQSLRRGACDFLDKPVSVTDLREAVERGLQATHSRRHLARTATAAQEIGRLQQMMLNATQRPGAPAIQLCFHPRTEAGGDSLNYFSLTPQCEFFLLTDVSGHDLRAAFVSAYFQGVVRGMLDRRVPVPEIFAYFNQLLLHEWSQAEPALRLPGLSASVAACSLLLHRERQEVTVLTSGAPLPLYVNREGRCEFLGQGGSYPLGWFMDQPAAGSLHSIAEGGSFFVWTDGLELLALERRVCAAAQVTALLLHPEPAGPADAVDDLLAARIAVTAVPEALPGFYPVLQEHYAGNEAQLIDARQAHWKRCLLCAAPSLGEALVHDVLLATREAVLNAQLHGCAGAADASMSLSVAYAPERGLVRVIIADPGPGHHYTRHLDPFSPEDDLIPEHRGLMLMHGLATEVHLQRNGALVQLDFSLYPAPPVLCKPTTPS